jgi:hypothetical protein
VIYKIKTPVEYSFHIWMSNHPDSTHWADKERFYTFVKTICRYRARKWKDAMYLKKRVLRIQPNFDLEHLDCLQDLFMQLLDYHNAPPLKTIHIAKGLSSATSNFHIEVSVKDGQIIERQVTP